MDSSTYYYDGQQDDDSPTLSPLSANFDQYIGQRDFEDSSFFDISPTNGQYSTLPPQAVYSMTPRATLGQRDPTFSLDFLPTRDNLQNTYLSDPLQLSQSMRNTSNPVTYQPQLSREDSSLLHSPSTIDSTLFFLPSPPEADESSTYPSPDTASDQRSEKRKRQPQQSTKMPGKVSPQSPTDDSHGPQRPTTQLRTASRTQKRLPHASSPRKLASAPEDVKARATHNHVEQQYRKRLNTQFQKLLAVLPQAECEGGGDVGASDGEDARGGTQKRISKAEVLDLARRRIKTLESERAVLERQKRELAGCVGRMQEEWTKRLGGEVPIKTER